MTFLWNAGNRKKKGKKKMIRKKDLLDALLDMMENSSFLNFQILKQIYNFVKNMEEVE